MALDGSVKPLVRKSSAVQKLLGRLENETKPRIRELAGRFIEKRLISSRQKTAAFEGGDDEAATTQIFAQVLLAVSNDDAAFDALVEVLRDAGFGELASKLLRETMQSSFPVSASTSSNPGDHATHGSNRSRPRNNPSLPGGASGGASPVPKYNRREVEIDSGIASRHHTGLLAQLTNSPEPRLPHLVPGRSVQPKLAPADPVRIPDNTSTPNVTSDPTQPLSTPLQEQEPHSYGNAQHPAPIQVAGNEAHPPNDAIVVANGDHLLSSNSLASESDVDLAEELRNMRQELQQMKAEGMQKDAENSDLQERCEELEEKVEQTTADLKKQKEETAIVLKEKNDAIKNWKQRYDDKTEEVEKLRVEIARKEREKDEIQKQHEETIDELNNEHMKTVRGHNEMILSLQEELKETKERKVQAEIDLAHAKVELSNAKMQKVQEELRLKEEMHKLKFETMELKLSLAQTREDLAKLELRNERRHSVHVQQQLQLKDDKIKELEQTVQRLTSQTSSASSGRDSPGS